MKKTYELTYIIADTVSDDKLADVKSELNKQIESLDGVIIREEPWGKRRLAYPIKKSQFGNYVSTQIDIDGSKINDLDRFMRLHGQILRHLLISALPKSIKATDEAELAEALEKRVTEKIAVEPEIVTPEITLAAKEEVPTEEAVEEVKVDEKPKTKTVRAKKSDATEKKEASDEERKKLVEEKLSEILKD